MLSALELLLHVPCPRLRGALPAVHQHIVHQSLERSVREPADVAAELIGDVGRVELVHLPAGGLGRCRSVAPTGVDMSDAQYNPSAFGSLPAQPSVGGHLLCQVEDIGTTYEAFAVLVHVPREQQQGACRPARLHLPVVAAGGCGETQTREAHGVLVDDFDDVVSPLLHVGQSEGHRLFAVLPIGVREVRVEAG